MRAGIAFGSNLGESLQTLREARAMVEAIPLLGQPFVASSIYLTSPVGCPPGSAPFLNAVLEVELAGEPETLLRSLIACEQRLGRAARGERNEARIIDLDLLYAGDREIHLERITVPHPRIAVRRFVLAPLAEIRPDLVLPGQSESVSQLLAKLGGADSAETLDASW